jgi:hypothetical protein
MDEGLASRVSATASLRRLATRISRSSPGAAFPVDAVDEVLLPQNLSAALQALAEAFGHADGGTVLWADKADDALFVQYGEGVGQGG